MDAQDFTGMSDTTIASITNGPLDQVQEYLPPLCSPFLAYVLTYQKEGTCLTCGVYTND